MKCPHCEYEHGFSNETYKHVEGQEGDFWQLPVKMEKHCGSWHAERTSLYACPSCSKTFIDSY